MPSVDILEEREAIADALLRNIRDGEDSINTLVRRTYDPRNLPYPNEQIYGMVWDMIWEGRIRIDDRGNLTSLPS